MRIGVIRKIEIESERYLEMSVNAPFLYPAKFRLFKIKSLSASAPNYQLYLQPPHPKKGEKQAAHNVGALWIRTNDKGDNYMSGYIESPLFASGKIGIVVFKPKAQEDWLYDVLTANDQSSRKQSAHYDDGASDDA
ncbi:MAG: DUF736 family protein [Helicobacteraceae bacterium]|jgi:uncharacterized protein (DUF736 family)|nr:DUF736 family protein [Helicobacteraceae bacterium]